MHTIKNIHPQDVKFSTHEKPGSLVLGGGRITSVPIIWRPMDVVSTRLSHLIAAVAHRTSLSQTNAVGEELWKLGWTQFSPQNRNFAYHLYIILLYAYQPCIARTGNILHYEACGTPKDNTNSKHGRHPDMAGTESWIVNRRKNHRQCDRLNKSLAGPEKICITWISLLPDISERSRLG